MRRKKYGVLRSRTIRVPKEWFAVSIKPGGIFFLLFVFGVVFANMMGKAAGKDLGIMSGYFMDKYMYADIQGRELFLYLFYKRFFEWFWLILLGIGIYGMVAFHLYIGFLGFSFGFLSVITIMNYGAKGILLMLGFLFPQYLCYIPGILMMYYGISSWKSSKSKSQMQESGRYQRAYLFPMILLMCGLLFFGILSESYVNPYILQNIIRNL